MHFDPLRFLYKHNRSGNSTLVTRTPFDGLSAVFMRRPLLQNTAENSRKLLVKERKKTINFL
mgnify:CR=1 FL=1